MIELIIAIVSMIAACFLGWSHGKSDLRQVDAYAKNGKDWCLMELAMCTHNPRKVLLRRAIQQLNRDIT